MTKDTWTGKGDGSSWTDAKNWSDGVPTSTSDVVINADTTITCPNTININSLTTSGSNIQLNDVFNLNVSGTIDLTGSSPSLTIQAASSPETIKVTAGAINESVPNSSLSIFNSVAPPKGLAASVVVDYAYLGSNSTLAINNGANASLTVNKGYSKSYSQGGSATYYPSPAGAGAAIACFLAGSMIRTPGGDVTVEDIRIGDEVTAFDWRDNAEIARKVVWVGNRKTTVRPALPDDEAGYPVRILKDAIADGVPFKDMLITAEHCLFFENRFVPVRMLVNGHSIFYDKSFSSYEYYHIETDTHSVIWADGMLTESYLDTGNRSSFAQHGKLA
ncbi:Hint domain-containing protein, partial [Acidomonas methanolica]